MFTGSPSMAATDTTTSRAGQVSGRPTEGGGGSSGSDAMLALDEMLRTHFGAKTIEEYLCYANRAPAKATTPKEKEPDVAVRVAGSPLSSRDSAAQAVSLVKRAAQDSDGHDTDPDDGDGVGRKVSTHPSPSKKFHTESIAPAVNEGKEVVTFAGAGSKAIRARKPPLYAVMGPLKHRTTPIRLSRRSSFVSQVHELAQRMAWGQPIWTSISVYDKRCVRPCMCYSQERTSHAHFC